MARVIAKDEDPFISNKTAAARKKDMEDWNKCIKNNEYRMYALTRIGYRCGSALDSECCAPIPQETLRDIMRTLVVPRILSGEMKVNGEPDNWSNGCFGSRWADFTPTGYDVSYIRVAFYSKKCDDSADKPWRHDKPYFIMATIEKERRY